MDGCHPEQDAVQEIGIRHEVKPVDIHGPKAFLAHQMVAGNEIEPPWCEPCRLAFQHDTCRSGDGKITFEAPVK